MLFTSNYTVSYKGRFYRAGEQFIIAEDDVAEMSKHGVVQPLAVDDVPPEIEEPPAESEETSPEIEEPPAESEETSPEIEEPPKRAGRTRKGAEQ